MSRPDGSYTLGVVGPAGPATHEYVLGVEEPLTGLVGEQIGCETISAGETLVGRDVRHFAPTSFVRGTVVDIDGDPLGGVCVEARSFSSCSTLVSGAVTDCDGNYELPVVDGSWFGEISPDDTAAIYGGLSPDRVDLGWTIAGNDLDGENVIVGPWRANPRIVAVEPLAVKPGAHLLITGYGFSAGGTPPEVRFGATPASVVAFLPDRGFLMVEVPLGVTAGIQDVTVRNVDLDATSQAVAEVTAPVAPPK